MPNLLTLPKELLLHILSFLPLPIIETLAQTYSYHITSTCLPLLQSLFTRRRHIKDVTAQFGDFGFTELFEFEILVQEPKKFVISRSEWKRMKEPTDTEMLERMEWLLHVFKGDLKWLEDVKPQNEPTLKKRPYSRTTKPSQLLK